MIFQKDEEIYTGQISFTLFYIFGMWQPLNWNSRWKIWLYRIYSIFMIIFYFSFSVTLIVYLLHVTAKRKTVIKLKNKLLTKFCRPRDIQEWDILIRCSQDCRWKIVIFLVTFSITAGTTFMSPLLKRSNLALPLRGWYPYNLDTKLMFTFTYFYQIIAVVMSAYIIASVDGFALTLMLQICAQLEIYIYRLQLLSEIYEKKNSNNNLCLQEAKILKDWMKHHTQVYSMGKSLNDLFGLVIFVQFFASIISICVIIYQLSRLDSQNPTYWMMVASVGSSLTQTFLYCLYGEKLIQKSTAVTNAIYEIDWTRFSQKTKKDLTVMMLRTTKPISLSGSSVIVMSIKTFMNIIKSAYSAYNLLGSTK
ncbi:odorant receptor 67c-like [Leptopilina heterotoma]|uniref:odorant receptor 67c-like n=1 Tax=Leptopilina heterotoma TaxID=63436 RepID=UPI001CA826C5|nr:odorant receptor 67c-like [Leptopilina heterotoma]